MQIIKLLQNNSEDVIVDAPLTAPDSNTWPITKQFLLYDQTVDTVSKEGQLFIPTIYLANDVDWNQWYEPLLKFIQSGEIASGHKTWIVGSAMKDLTNNPREPQSHAEGHAVDITPIWSDTHLIDPDGANPALAWNLATLTALSHYNSTELSWVVEGDHIHLTNIGQPLMKEPGVVAVFTSLSSAYPLYQLTADNSVLNPLLNKIYGFKVEQDSITFARLTSDADLFNYIGE